MTGADRAAPSVLAVTSGEPAGIGPELCATLVRASASVRPVILGDRNLLARRARLAGIDVAFADYDPVREVPAGCLDVIHVPLAVPSEPGRIDPGNAHYVLALLDRAIDGCVTGQFAGLVTAPVHKGVLNNAGVPFRGHTEYLAEKTGTPRVVMMLVGGGLRVALATTHLALKDVPAAITAAELERTLRIVDADLRQHFGVAAPTILVAGLNPHAGEGGHMGREEIDVIAPVVETLRREGLSLLGPLPADTLFTPRVLSQGDAVLAMYHDQGLATLKYASFGQGVNVTLGLPIIRTSVDHGTALDLAGSGKADPGSLDAAIALASQMAEARGGRAAAVGSAESR